jgi:uncharacterized protein (DUF1800 family)
MPTDKSWDIKGLWIPYTPGTSAPWNLRRVVHLHRRAGFAASWSELQRDLKDGPTRSIDRLLAGSARSEGVPEDFAFVADTLAERAAEVVRAPAGVPGSAFPANPSRLKAWWLYRMFHGPDPLGERLTLLWHDHFATSNAKVRDLPAMRRQNELFRKHGRGSFADLLKAVVADPALLVWLDAPANRKGRPNENLARELMELFTLGIGHFTETDVKEAARALTGWFAEGGTRGKAEDHDDGEKTILGRKGKWRGEDLVRIVLEHPATSRRLAWRICGLLMGEKAVDAAALDALAAGLRANRLRIGWAVETVLRSLLFFDERNLGNRILGPVEYVIGTARALECFDPPPRSVVLGEWTARLGQDLFYPPNVAGWPGGRSWLGTQAIIGRANYAAALVEGKLTEPPSPPDLVALSSRHGRGRDLDAVLTFCAELLTGAPLSPAWRKRLLSALGPKPTNGRETIATAVALLIASPEVQLG